ncbi:hypothetical protein BG005_010383 [Podila minutissima]|nr:hypothetical protein BG005_010383 [Podila minutissima]
MVSQPRKPKTRLCLLLGAAIVLFHAVALTTPVFAAKAEQHPLDTSYSAPKATKVQSKTHIHKFAKTKKTDKKKEKTAHHKTPTIKKDTSLVDTTFEATKMDAGSLQNSIAGLWDNVVQFGKYEAPVLQSEIDQVLRNELIGLLEIQGGRNLQQQQQDEEQQDQNSDVEVILTRKHRRAAKHKSRHIKRNARGYLERVDGGHPRKYRHRKEPGKLRGGKRHRKNRHVGHRVPAPPAITVQPAMPSPHPVPPLDDPKPPATDDDDDENLKSPSTPEAPDVEDFPRPAIVVSPAEPKDTLPDPTSLPDDDPLDSPSTPNENNDDSDDVIASPHVTEMPKGPAPAPVARETGPKSRVVAGPVPAPMAGTPPPVAEAPIPPLPKQQQQQQQSNAPVANPLPLAPTAPKQMVPPKPNLLVPVAEPDDDEEEDDDEEGDDEQDDEKTPNDSALVDDEGRDKEDGSIEAGKGMDVEEADEDEDEDDGDEGEDEEGDIEEEDKKKTQKDREEGGEKRKVMMPVLQKRQVLVQAVKRDKLEASMGAQDVPDAKPIDAKTELKEDQKTEKKEAKKEEEVAAAATATVADDKKEDKSQGNFARVEKSKRYPKEQPVMEPAKEQEPVAAAAVEKAKEKTEKKKEKKNHKNNKDDLLLGAQQYQNTMTDYNTKEIVFADGGADGQKKKKNKMKKKDKMDREAEEEAQLDKNGLKDKIVHEPQGDEIDQPVKAAKVHKKHEKHNNNENQDALEPMTDVVEDAPLQDQPTFEVFKGHNNDNNEKEDKKKKDKHDKEDKGNQKGMDNKDQGNNALPPPPSPPPPPPLPAPAQDNNNNKPAPKGQQGNTAPQVPPAGMSPDRNTKAGGGTDYDTVPMFGPAQLDLVSEAVKLCSGWRAHATAVIAVVFVNML